MTLNIPIIDNYVFNFHWFCYNIGQLINTILGFKQDHSILIGDLLILLYSFPVFFLLFHVIKKFISHNKKINLIIRESEVDNHLLELASVLVNKLPTKFQIPQIILNKNPFNNGEITAIWRPLSSVL
jgi:hypothetical protein